MREARSARGKVAKRERADAVMHANEIAERLRGGRKLARPRNGAVHENFVALSRADMATSPRALMKTVGSDDIHDDIDMAGRACATEPVATVSVVWCRAPPRISSAKRPLGGSSAGAPAKTCCRKEPLSSSAFLPQET